MGTRTGRQYTADFPEGTVVRILAREHLQQFRGEWRFHHPLQQKQLEYAGREAVVRRVSFYHGGTELYELKSLPGIWHECCLRALEEPDGQLVIPL